MTPDIIITICVIVLAMILFATEVIRIDLVALLIIVTLIITGVITPEQGVQGFSNTATITVAFMFALSAAMLQTGALQFVAEKLSSIFEENFNKGMILMMLMIAVISAFINNTPVVAVFIPVIIKIANLSGRDPKKMLIPLSFASIFGGTCTLVGTSTNILVSGIAEKEGLEAMSMFQLAPVGIIFLVVGIIYLLTVGIRLLPETKEKNLDEEVDVKEYLTEIELEKRITANEKEEGENEKEESETTLSLITDMDVDVLEVRRSNKNFSQPSEDFELQEGDIIKVRCSSEKIKKLKKWAENNDHYSASVGSTEKGTKYTSLVELIILANSPLDGKKLRSVDFKGSYRAIPLAVRQREGVLQNELSEITLKSGDIVLAEVKDYFKKKIDEMGNEPEAPFAILSEDKLTTFNKKNFYIVAVVVAGVIGSASLGLLHIMTAAILGVSILVLTGILNMKELYKAIDWQVIFLLAGALSLGTAMSSSGLDVMIAEDVVQRLDRWGPVAVISGVYILTSIMTELMTNNAAAALMAPIAIATANSLNLDPVPFILAIAFAGSASFLTPVGYQTNTMVYSAGKYRFRDFVKVGGVLNIIFWIIATFMIPLVYGL